MRVAIPIWRGRISPVFDVAGHVLVVDFAGGVEQARQEVAFATDDPQRRAARLAEIEADVLVCGAISRPLELALLAAGIDVLPQTCGEVEQVLAAFARGELPHDAFRMPGCCGRRRPCRARRRRRRGADLRGPAPGTVTREFSSKQEGGEDNASR